MEMEFEEEFSFPVVVVSFAFVLFIYLSIFFITHFEIFIYMFRLLQRKMRETITRVYVQNLSKIAI